MTELVNDVDVVAGETEIVKPDYKAPKSDWQEYRNRVHAKRHADKATKFSDARIIEQIENASEESDSYASMAYAQTALAMMEYNRMIDRRWDNA